ncbi:phosphate ABC transporter permease [Leptolyngbya sp. NK1-12]|uniref:Phosphate ABC transporter permease n=1 Tax=Leptolyngbya sp. NK1-12 TaxID=2547451 RepID=A0AA96WBW3_9CYAN|nr:phosphate ABC transporter permease [Leptolyngbya sp. NK1-12]WNZ22269.1 phosphate ABC transporter permease [Leptolyngbya sp. NK1-12]
MLIPITRKKFEELIPLTATADQYKYYWGKFPDILQRVLISVAAVVAVLILRAITGGRFEIIIAFLGAAAGLYWLWEPVYRATRRNWECRKYKYSGFFRGEVLDLFVTEELIGKEETVNKQGELVIIENRERRINLDIGDETGFLTTVQAPLLRIHRSIRRGDVVELLVMSNRPDLSRISFVSDVFLPDNDLWVSDYPYVRKDIFMDVSRRLGQQSDGWRGEDNLDNEPRRRIRKF